MFQITTFKNSLFVFCINEETKSKIKQFNSILTEKLHVKCAWNRVQRLVCSNLLQGALIICGFVILGFDYPRLVNCWQNLLSAVTSLSFIHEFCSFWRHKRIQKSQNSVPLLFAVLEFTGYSLDATPVNNEDHQFCTLYQNQFFLVKASSKTLLKLTPGLRQFVAWLLSSASCCKKKVFNFFCWTKKNKFVAKEQLTKKCVHVKWTQFIFVLLLKLIFDKDGKLERQHFCQGVRL